MQDDHFQTATDPPPFMQFFPAGWRNERIATTGLPELAQRMTLA